MGKLGQGVLRLTLVATLLLGGAAAAVAQSDEDPIAPPGFFSDVPAVSPQASISADRLTYDADTHQVVADGHVEVDYDGSMATGDRLVFDQRAHVAHFIGKATLKAKDGVVYTANDLVLSDATHDALMRELTISMPGGGLVTAGDGEFQRGVATTLNEATYSACGQCIDAKGRRIGWSAKATRMVYNNQSSTVTLEQPTLYLLGVPVAWLPWLSLPDPTKRMNHFMAPSLDYSKQIGLKVSAPYFFAVGADDDLIFTPSLLSRQGVMLGAEWDHRFVNGAMSVKTTGIYQLDPSAFAGTVGDRTWRGAFQTAGRFTPAPDWKVGWSYTAFTDAAYLTDYHFREYTDTGLVNEVYATELSRDQFIDFRLQQFNLLGNITPAQQDQQARALPNLRYRDVVRLPGDNGEVDLSASLLGVDRPADASQTTVGGVDYRFGYAEAKAHGTSEADWQKQFVLPGGLVATPYLGLRADAAYYDGSSPLMPGAEELFNATPIAAMDLRFPFLIRQGTTSAIFEPITQLYYRGSDTTDVGITNDNAQSFVFDDTNLFSYNRFSGTDRQETGLRANVGAHYQVNFADGAWLDLIGGQSFQLAGANAFAAPDPTQVTTGQGLDDAASYMVFGAKGSPVTGLNLAAKLQVDPAGPRVTRGGVGATYSVAKYDFGMDYLFIAQDLERGITADQQEVAGNIGVPIDDYWRATGHASWDVARNTWLDAGAGLHYNDGYLGYGADIEATGPTNIDANDLRVTASLWLKGLGGTK